MKNSAKSFRGFGCRFFTMGVGRRCYGGLWRRVVRVGDERIGGGGRWSVDGEFGWGTRGRNGVRKRMAAGCYLSRQTFHRRQGGLWPWLLLQAVSSKVSTLGHSHYYSTHNASIFTNFHLIPVLHPPLLPRARLLSTATQPESPLFRSKAGKRVPHRTTQRWLPSLPPSTRGHCSSPDATFTRHRRGSQQLTSHCWPSGHPQMSLPLGCSQRRTFGEG
ncbi:uncharacterized protein CCOS01_12400 [Colletotrichum costaricense]|uniref:Uncharacterized protein n=1 Tax=Colletotrichum costaricense TaxID=1209916 RepID=A0AAI9YMK3_9PEZI|nr:uncharacterized protein CCOS01_12400 [Colletotrichum costaricense]KAK1516851.1 hypothetical protein CCOS01_12400 [Colletotrichum costaricense]